ncbi:MAG: NUDIX hydrolase [Acidobacteria bacterium]|nr:NUDIX hydrolase [Acidobacteriota bacterium]
MKKEYEWIEVDTVYREIRGSKHGDELRWLVNRETIRNTQSGETITRATIRHPGICVMVPYADDGRIMLMRQYRYAVDRALWELPAGTLEGREKDQRMIAVETPEACAARELLEETGFEASVIDKAGQCYAMPGMSDEMIHVFFASGLTKREQALDIGEVIYEVRPHTIEELKGMIEKGDICDAKTLVGLFLAFNAQPVAESGG